MSDIAWPEHFAPANCPIHVRNEIATSAPPDLATGTRFRWRTFGVTITSTVREHAPPFRLAWDAYSFGSRPTTPG